MSEYLCESIVTTGKNKGKQCSRRKTNGSFCKQHYKINLMMNENLKSNYNHNYQYVEPSAPPSLYEKNEDDHIPIAEVIVRKRDKIKYFFNYFFHYFK